MNSYGKALCFLGFFAVAACSTAATGAVSGSSDPLTENADASTNTASWSIRIDGKDYQGGSVVAGPSLTALPGATIGTIYNGYFMASSDTESNPSIHVDFISPTTTLHEGDTFRCANGEDLDPKNTSVYVQGTPNGDYYSNAYPNLDCTITVVSVSNTWLSLSFQGSMWKQHTDPTAIVPFSGTISTPLLLDR